MQILLATDGSSYARLAEELLQRIPEWRDAEITVVSVAAPLTYGLAAAIPGAGLIFADKAMEAYEVGVAAARDFANAAVERLTSAGLKASAAYLEGDVGSELLDFAERNKIAGIAVGSRGQGTYQNLLLGSVARKLVSNAHCHVLVARVSKGMDIEESIAAIETKSHLTAALGVDGSPGSDLILEFIKRQGTDTFEKLVAICAEPLAAVPSGLDPANFVDLYRHDHERAVEVVERAAQALAAPSKTEIIKETELGRPSAVIESKAAEHGADLIIVSATRHSTFERFLIGSVSFELATESPCSVLVIRPPAE